VSLLLQKKEILSDPKLPDIFRIALAKSLQDDLFAQVRHESRVCWWAERVTKLEEADHSG
jgi:hypothetical protein